METGNSIDEQDRCSSDCTTDRNLNPGLGEKQAATVPIDGFANVDGTSPITYYYLSFDTALPTVPMPQRDVCPPCPDLRPYVSPLRWSAARKNVSLALSCMATFLTAYTAGCYLPPAAVVARDLQTTRIVTTVGMVTFCTGFAFAPMALAPISEIWGRFPVFIVAGVVFVVSQATCAVTPHISGLLAARFFVGAGASVFSSVVGGVIADLWDKAERNTPMALFSGFVLVGTGAGPLVSTAFIKRFGQTTLAWKWTVWHQAILDGVLLILFILFFKESRASVLLARKADKLNQWYEELESKGIYGVCLQAASAPPAVAPCMSFRNTCMPCGANTFDQAPNQGHGSQDRQLRIRWVVKGGEQRPPVFKLMSMSVRRPFHMLFTEPVVFSFSLWAAFSWAILYMSFSVVPFLYETSFNLSSRVYGAIMAAAVIATALSILQQHLLKHPQWRVHEEDFKYSDSNFWALMRKHFPSDSPEARLYFACITALFLPAGLFGAFLCPQYMNGYAEAVGLGFAVWGIYSVYLATFNYLADSYQSCASSALAAQNFCRNVLGGIFPLIVQAMFTNLGVNGAGVMLGGIATVLSTKKDVDLVEKFLLELMNLSYLSLDKSGSHL
ncbi:Major facilitator superfamily domain, general substrate transporter [Metarhizium album ARSEF 1941]|uniref:Major facilitator superfamily domain, general substrate transporter n=1 Tax=Metarhizium album (strain ARSEF 1941) TaxID=1081103 RepID=A0A0B2WNC0_METAS|nr:Major facilitator superfamily domain, general substrate transporter [Metarhizium album ARSEF 1941]KHN95448.1 Major facilitator superfamily domain, general substrate transporter [Metarhizium album ARSEF 1941]